MRIIRSGRKLFYVLSVLELVWSVVASQTLATRLSSKFAVLISCLGPRKTFLYQWAASHDIAAALMVYNCFHLWYTGGLFGSPVEHVD